MDIRAQVGAAIRRHRHAAGLSQEAMAEHAGIDRSYASGLERGVRNPTVVILERVATALGVRPADLLLPPEPRTRAARAPARRPGTTKAP